MLWHLYSAGIGAAQKGEEWAIYTSVRFVAEMKNLFGDVATAVKCFAIRAQKAGDQASLE
jgi:hypothetical protein